MSLINMVVAARAALARSRRQRQAYNELMALDDRALADIGIHRSQIPALAFGAADELSQFEGVPETVTASAFGRGAPRLASGQTWLPPL